ncbi:MAG TPA: TetR-like C-terminal domain-containing protein [Sphingomicrobium sp.]
MTVGEPTRRPGGRTAEVTRRINDAVLALLVEGGIGACTFAAVADRADVERSTLYRRYGDRWAMMIDAILGYAADEVAPLSLQSFREDLRFVLDRMAEVLATPLGPALWAVGAALRAGSAPEHRARFWETRLAQILPIIDQAKGRGELDPGVDPEEVFAFAMGAVHFRMLVIGERIGSKVVDQIVDDVCRLYCLGQNRQSK